MDCLTGFYAGFAIFTVLGHMYITKCVDSMEAVAAAGPELAFIVYPEGNIFESVCFIYFVLISIVSVGLSLIKAVPPLWSILFFLMMLALGFGSEVNCLTKSTSWLLNLICNLVFDYGNLYGNGNGFVS